MTRKEAIEELKKVDTLDMSPKLCEAHYMAINSLEIDERYGLEYEQAEPKTDVLDKIRAEILNFREKCNASDYLGCGILEIIDKYKAESEDKE